MKKSGIYIIKNVMNNKVYVGQSKDVYRRYYQHLYCLKNNRHPNKHLQNSFNKWGENNFEFIIVFVFDVYNKNILNIEENNLIEKLNTCDSFKGFNKTINKTKDSSSSDKFFMTFIEMIAPVYKLKSLSDLKLMIKFCEIAEFNTGKFNISPSLRKEICSQLGMSTNSFSISLKSLTEKKLIKGSKGSYILNPEIHWKGTMDARNEMLKEIRVTFDF